MQDRSEVIKTRKVINELRDFVSRSVWKSEYLHRLEALLYRVEQPCELAVAGRVKAGKSSFINALLGSDLAMVGTTETTATINYFRYGTPDDPSKPIRVVWRNGEEEYHSVEFLNSLQGNTKEVLNRASNIDMLEYILDNEILKHITLVDTPGTDALVSEHEQRTDDYFSTERNNLRQRQSAESKKLTEKADAVIFITADKVPTQYNKKFLNKYFGNDGHSTNSMNALGLMTKIDIMTNPSGDTLDYQDIKTMGKSMASSMKEELNSVLPISAGLHRELKRMEGTNALRNIYDKINTIPSSIFTKLLDSDTRFLTEERVYLKKCEEAGVRMLSTHERKDLLDNMLWGTFVIIAKALYGSDYTQAKDYLYTYSGMDEVKNVLETQFFKRSRTIRCSSIALEMRAMLVKMMGEDMYDLEKEISLANEFNKLIAIVDNKLLANKMQQFISRHISTNEQIKQWRTELNNIMRSVEQLINDFRPTTESNESLLLLMQHSKHFTKSELEELEQLFGREKTKLPINGARQIYWRTHKMLRNTEPNIRRIVELAIAAYGRL